MSRPRATSTEVAVLDSQPRTAVPADAPPSLVGGGWVGWLGYDVAAHLAFYDHLLRFDYGERRWSFQALWTRRRASALRARRQQLRELLAVSPSVSPSVSQPAGDPAPPSRIGEFAGPDRDRHLGAIEAAIGLIRAGEIYQANICTRLAADFDGPPESGAELFARAVGELRPRFAAFISTAERAVVSLSPESFLSRTGDRVTSSPIKGTWARGADERSELSATRLRSSAKDVAENVMIVDLVRNDLGRVARPGTVRVERLLDVQPHPGVWHLVSTVSGQLRPSVGDAELVAATFPPGSVTGTPKLRAMSAIADIEDAPRGVYTGAIGIAGPVCGLQLSVAIRTFELVTTAHGTRVELGVGGGITADSVPELEWRECAQKAMPLLSALGARPLAAFSAVAAEPEPWQRAGGLIETMLAVDGTVLRLADHLARLDRSARELYDQSILTAGAGELAERIRASVAATSGRWAVRAVLVPGAGLSGVAVEVSAALARPRPSESRLDVVTRPGVWRHKWADRSWIEVGERAYRGPLYAAADGTVLETARGNVFVLDHDGVLVTPPLRDDLLPGVTRRAILDLARDRGWAARIESFGVDAVYDAAAVFWTSSLSGVVPITAVDGRALTVTTAAGARLAAIAAGIGISLPARNDRF
jgi:para-aminobenzoate synthetase/4-amino-4-deoxychorismate lyase